VTAEGEGAAEAQIAADTLGFFRWGKIGDRILVTNDAGDWLFLDQGDFDLLLTGGIGAEHPRFAEFQSKGLLREGLDLDAFATRVAQRNKHIRRGPYLHVVNISGSVADPTRAMSTETATAIVDFAIKGTSPAMTFELQAHGGEPLCNFATVRHLVETAQARNKRDTGKTLRFRLISNFSAMTEETAEWLIAQDVLPITYFDGAAAVHEANRAWSGAAAHADVKRWLDFFRRRYEELGRDLEQWRVDSLLNVTRRTIEAWDKVLEAHVAAGSRVLRLQPLDSSRFDAATWKQIGYSAAEYVAFHRRALADILQLNHRGTEISEGLATVIAAKILNAEEPGIVDIQSPYGAGTGQIAYDADGIVFPCDEARRADTNGDAVAFALGAVNDLALADVARHPTVRAIATASLLDAQPLCSDCWNKPYCGYSPVRNYIARGDLFGRRTSCLECAEHIGVSRQIFESLGVANSATAEILKRWAAARPTDGRARIEPF